ncbi:DUF1501 domain-containing protein [Dokdonella soli]|uniref:DUF1501 domain-containing protein n=1 Tax=Dokdonella soli TaxID=529810 RepID=A0ABN1IIU1_9GAMM
MTSFSSSRRDFLRKAACSSLAAASGSALLTQLSLMNSALAATSCASYPPVSDYRALVCLFLLGGNDSWNLLVPTDTARYNTYVTSRSGIINPAMPNNSGMAVDSSQLLPVNVLNAGSGHTYGVHPSCPELASLFNSGAGAFGVNIGTLLQPTTKTTYGNGSVPLPPQLFSHADQQGQWQYGQPTANGSTGWGGLMSDRLYVLNAGATIPMSISLSGQNRFQAGINVQPYSISGAGPIALGGYTGSAGTAKLNALEELLALSYPDPLSRTYASKVNNAIGYYNTMSSALAGAPTLNTVFPANNPVADALKMIAKVISVRGALQAKRQVFFVSYGSFDTHDTQVVGQPKLLSTISSALGAFYNATVELGVQNSVTSFTLSEFARTLNSNGDGTDHAWAGNQFVMGGSVKGQNIYGRPAVSGGLFPDQTLNGPDCLARGQMIPGASCDQYSATLARWLGLNDCDIATIFPYVNNFNSPTWDLGFMS